ncbi:MAG: hypothetical protein SFZ24_10950 [Planctomycetota bacterium]|nr:hypothetical protein [Planctomycetota bacterium]
MSQFAMQMPGSQRRRSSTMNIYTGLLLGAVFCLAAAVGFVAYAGMQVGPGEGPLAALKFHPEGRVEFK